MKKHIIVVGAGVRVAVGVGVGPGAGVGVGVALCSPVAVAEVAAVGGVLLLVGA